MTIRPFKQVYGVFRKESELRPGEAQNAKANCSGSLVQSRGVGIP